MRWLRRAVLREVIEDGADRGGLFDAGHDAYRAAAVDAGGHVDAEHALEALCPGHRTAAFIRLAGAHARLRSAKARRGTESDAHAAGAPAPPAWR